MTHPAFFGYGSLVNRATHTYEDPHKAQLTGWHRVWKHSARRTVAFLSVEPDETSSLLGLVAHVQGADWSALDAREAAYTRRDVTHQIRHDRPLRNTALYTAAPAFIAPAGTLHPILLSYLDVVIQGYLSEFGQDGVRHFFDTTTGWDGPVLDDRAAPLYPRHQSLTRREKALVTNALDDLGVTRVAQLGTTGQ